MNHSFPSFKSINLEDRSLFVDVIKRYRPETSEWTFTNLFIWRTHYHFRWSVLQDWLVVIAEGPDGGTYALQPLGPPNRTMAVKKILEWLREEKGEEAARIEKADARLVEELEVDGVMSVDAARDQFDYIYLMKDLAGLAGHKYRSKRNHINQLLRTYKVGYTALEEKHLTDCLEMQERWCEVKRCEDDLSLLSEWDAVREILMNFTALDLRGGIVEVEGRIEAFTVGEVLNDETAVIHIEKANAEIPGLYAVINQQCCENCWRDITYVNREQDLGIPGLREAKISYYPHHFAEKFTIRLI
jgi:hypothetical protein